MTALTGVLLALIQGRLPRPRHEGARQVYREVLAHGINNGLDPDAARKVATKAANRTRHERAI